MARADEAGSYGADALGLLLAAPRPTAAPAPVLLLPGVPAQAEIDRLLSVYEAWVQVDVARPAAQTEAVS